MKSLERTSEPEEILDCMIMILFQKTKQLYVTGSLLSGPLLKMLLDDRRTPDTAGRLLKALASQIQEGQSNDMLVTAVKECGLSKDIGKHHVHNLDELLET